MACFTAIVLSAGKGSRMKSSVHKQYLLIQERPIIYYTLKAFEESPVDEIVLVVGAGEETYCREEIIDKYHFHKVTAVIEGGKERYHSVFNGLSLCEKSDYVLIHDGARPLVSGAVIRRAMETVEEKQACIAAVPVKDTIKLTDSQGVVTATPDRNSLWSVQTPQAFGTSAIRTAYEKMMEDDNSAITDDAMVMEQYGDLPVHIFEGDYCNIKITTEEDMTIAESILCTTGKIN